MIIIPSMSTRFRHLPQLEIDLEVHELRTLAFVLDRIVSPESYTAGLCVSVDRKLHQHALVLNRTHIAYKFSKAVCEGMNPPTEKTYHQYIDSYLSKTWNRSITVKELATIRDTWAAHIARFIYEQIGD